MLRVQRKERLFWAWLVGARVLKPVELESDLDAEFQVSNTIGMNPLSHPVQSTSMVGQGC